MATSGVMNALGGPDDALGTGAVDGAQDQLSAVMAAFGDGFDRGAGAGFGARAKPATDLSDGEIE